MADRPKEPINYNLHARVYVHKAQVWPDSIMLSREEEGGRD